MINILTDSNADIPKDLLAKYCIKTIPMHVQLNGSVYSDGETITQDEIFKNVEKTGKYPTTFAPPPSEFIEFFDRNEPSIFIEVSGQLSATIKNALVGKQELGKKDIEIINSRRISIGYGNVVLQAAKWRDEAIAFNELVQKIRNLVTATRGIIIINSLEYFYHGIRCSAIDHFASSLLKIRPFLNIKPDGTLGVLKKVRGSRNKAVKELFNYFKDQYLHLKLTISASVILNVLRKQKY